MGGQAALGFVAGYVDTVSFVCLGGIFVTMVTGNVVLVGASVLTGPNATLVPNLTSVPVFVAAIAVHSGLRHVPPFARLARDERMRILLMLQAVLLALFAIAGRRFSEGGLPVRGTWPLTFVAALGVLAMSVQNAFTRLVGSTRPPTTIMTGNLVQVTMAAVDLLAYRRVDDERVRALASISSMGPALLGFFAGAVCAAPLRSRRGWDSIRSGWRPASCLRSRQPPTCLPVTPHEWRGPPSHGRPELAAVRLGEGAGPDRHPLRGCGRACPACGSWPDVAGEPPRAATTQATASVAIQSRRRVFLSSIIPIRRSVRWPSMRQTSCGAEVRGSRGTRAWAPGGLRPPTLVHDPETGSRLPADERFR